MLGIIHGRLTRDPELKTFKTKDGSDGAVTNFSVACDNHYGAKTETSFYNCSVFGKRAEAINKFMSKGSEIVVTGYLEQEEYKDKNGDNKRAWKLSVTDFDFCGRKGETNGTPAGGFTEVTDEDIPF